MIVVPIIIVVMLGIGLIYEWRGARADQKKYPPIGKLVAVGGYRLHIYCLGEEKDSPVVVFEAGSGGGGMDWALVQPEVALFAPAFVYDRAGYGWSDRGPKPRTPEKIADELVLLLTNAGVPGPYILVGHAFGGILVRMFLKQHPDKVAGLVLIDSTHPRILIDESAHLEAEVRRLRRVAIFRRLGLVRFMSKKIFQKVNRLPEEKRALYLALCRRNAYGVPDEVSGILAQEIDLSDSIGNLPLIVVSRSLVELFDGTIAAESQRWQELQKELATLSANSTHIVADKGGRFVQFDQPEVVIAAIRQMVETVRAQ